MRELDKRCSLARELKREPMSEILVRYGEQRAIAQILEVSDRTVRKALRGDSSVMQACKIRRIALERGGVELNK